MASGVTQAVADGEATLREFLMRVGRNLTLSIHQRDSDPRNPVQPRVVSAYAKQRMEDAAAELRRLEAMTLDEIRKAARAEYEDRREMVEAIKRSKAAVAENYDAMIEQVQAWEPEPVVAYVKDRALETLEESRRFDCEGGIPSPPPAMDYDPPRWHAAALDRARKERDSAVKAYKVELERVASFNVEIEAFLRSLPDA